MKLGVDARWMVGDYRGMGRFARQLISPVSASVIALTPSGCRLAEWPQISSGNGFFPWWEQIVLPRLCRVEQLDYLLCPYNTGPLSSIGSTRSIAVIHDLIFMQPWTVLPPSMSLYQTLGRLYRRQVVPAFAKRVDTIVTVSEFTKSELIRKFGLSPSAINVIPNSIADHWFETPVHLSNREQFIFTVAGEAPSKNLIRLLNAFALVCASMGENVILKVAGVKPAFHSFFRKHAHQLGIGERVELLGFLSEQELRQYYRNARLFVFASLFEGFGIPLLEAMASGTPVVCSNSTSMPEVIGSHGLLFDPLSINDMAEKIYYLWLSDTESLTRSCGGLERARLYSESSVIEMTNAFWRNLS
jgi:glycosyltransferase involved in cell wall biosynthesis